LKLAEGLVKAAKVTRVRYRQPTVRLVLPRIKAIPETEEVANILQKIRDMGVMVETADDIPLNSPALSEVLPAMAADLSKPLTNILNVDCTVLLAFVSDLSYCQVEPESWHNKNIAYQIKSEVNDLLLPTCLWPTIGSRKLVCTREARAQMQNIVDIIGTDSEKRRTTLLFDTNLPKEQLLQEFQTLSGYPVPQEWALPIGMLNVPSYLGHCQRAGPSRHIRSKSLC